MRRTFLQRVAAAMYAAAARDGQASRDLSGGLHLWLCHADDAWMLALQRDDVPPSATEIATCRRDFAVPADAQQLTTGRFTGLYWTGRPAPDPAFVPEPEQLTLVVPAPHREGVRD
jgi:hypothetical protein